MKKGEEEASTAKIVPSSSIAGGESTSTSDQDPCPICLGSIVDESYLDTCFHKFCYNCIVRWSKVVASKQSCVPSSVKCPLCKIQNFSIVLGYNGGSFQRHYINQNCGDSYFFPKAHRYRLQCYYTEPGTVDDIFNVSRFWKSRKYLQSNRWLQSWMRRELQALMQEEDVDIIVHHIAGMIDSFLKRTEQTYLMKAHETIQEEFQAVVSDAAKPFLRAGTERFIKEMELFLASGLNIEAYDATYVQRLGWNSPKVTSTSANQRSETAPVVPYLFIFNADSDGED